jgi:excisionase family DNA binding protein
MSALASRLLTVKELAGVLSLRPDTVYRMVADGRIRALRIAGHAVRITPEEVARLTSTPEFDATAAGSER